MPAQRCHMPAGIQYSRYHTAPARIAIMIAALAACRSADARCPAWNERSEVYYDAASRALERRYIRVCVERTDLADLEFSWTSEGAPVRRPDGKAEGRGRLIWRRPGSAPYDTRSIIDIYDGELKRGRRHGFGRLETRFGTSYEGKWRHGLPEGEGVLRLTNGDEYRGKFLRGFPIGIGHLVRANGAAVVGILEGNLCAADDAKAMTPLSQGMICGLVE